MKAMIMSAGRGKRLQPITDTTPKPLVKVGGKSLIVHHIEALKHAGVTDIVINLGYLGEKIRAALGDGEALDVNIAYTQETDLLEVGGGIANALPLLGDNPFILVNGDIWTDFPFSTLLNRPIKFGHIVLVPNPEHHLSGDFTLMEEAEVTLPQAERKTYTYAGIALFHPQLFQGIQGAYSLKRLLDKAIAASALTGQVFQGHWFDVGTMARLQTLRSYLGDCVSSKSN